MQEKHLIGEPACLPQVMGRHDDLRTALRDLRQQDFDRFGGSGIEIGGGLIQQQDLGLEHPSPRQRQALLLATGQQPCRSPSQIPQASLLQGFVHHRPALPTRHAVEAQGIADVRRHGAPQQYRTLKHHGLISTCGVDIQAMPPNRPTGWADEPMTETQQQALAGTVRSQHQRLGLGLEYAGDVVDEVLPCDLKTDLV